MKLTEQQRDVLKLVARSPDRGQGWRSCARAMFEQLILPMSDELVEKDIEHLRVRLTDVGRTLVEWV